MRAVVSASYRIAYIHIVRRRQQLAVRSISLRNFVPVACVSFCARRTWCSSKEIRQIHVHCDAKIAKLRNATKCFLSVCFRQMRNVVIRENSIKIDIHLVPVELMNCEILKRFCSEIIRTECCNSWPLQRFYEMFNVLDWNSVVTFAGKNWGGLMTANIIHCSFALNKLSSAEQ